MFLLATLGGNFLISGIVTNPDPAARYFNRSTRDKVEVIFIEVNSLPGMTPATCIFHQAAIAKYKPLEFIDKILSYGIDRKEKQSHTILN